MRLDALIADDRWRAGLGGDAETFARRVLDAAASLEAASGEVSLLLTGADELRRLNLAHRGVDKPTNVLAFPAPPSAAPLLGDIAIAYEATAAEAKAQGKTLQAHAAHLMTHGFLHLLGYDHLDDRDAEEMEARERAILAELGIADPYALERV